jgi:cytoskeletal protein CcmA (bactofilin family)
MLSLKRNRGDAGERRGPAKTPSVIAGGLTVKGELQSSGEIRIDGTVEGNLAAPVVTIGRAGSIKGNIAADRAMIEGEVAGQIKAKSVVLARTAKVRGDVLHATLKVEPGATVDGSYRPIEPDAPFAAEIGAAPGVALPRAMLRGRTLVVLGGGFSLLALVAFAYPPHLSPPAAAELARAEPASPEPVALAVESDRPAAAEASPPAPTRAEKLPSIVVKPRPVAEVKPLPEPKPVRAVAAKEKRPAERRRAPTLAAGRDETTPGDVQKAMPMEADAAPARNAAPPVTTYTRLDTN